MTHAPHHALVTYLCPACTHRNWVDSALPTRAVFCRRCDRRVKADDIPTLSLRALPRSAAPIPA